MKKYKNINEETNRIKSLFTEERLYGNLVGKDTKNLNEQLRRILKLFGDSFQNVDSLKKQFKVLGNFQEGLFDQYVKIIKRGDQVDLLNTIRGKYIFELLPEKVRYDALLDYVDSIDDVAEQKEILTKISKYFDDNPSIKPKNMDEFDSMFKKIGKSVDDIDLEKFARDLSKQADNSPSGILIFDPKNLSTEQKKKIIDEMGLTDKFITNKSSQEVAEDFSRQTGIDISIGTNGIKKLASKLKNVIIKPADFVASFGLPGYSILKNILKGKNITTVDWLSTAFAKTPISMGTFPFIYSLFKTGELGWANGWALMMNDLKEIGITDKVLKFIGDDICNALETSSEGKLKCEDFAKVYKETIDKILEQVKNEDFDYLCKLLSENEDNMDFMKVLMKDKNAIGEIRNSLKEKLGVNSSPDFIDELLNKFSKVIGISVEQGLQQIYFSDENVKSKVNEVLNSWRNLCEAKEGDFDEESTETSTTKKPRRHTRMKF